jgi:hypothetical protein
MLRSRTWLTVTLRQRVAMLGTGMPATAAPTDAAGATKTVTFYWFIFPF